MSGETFGAMLRRLRVERGYSQSELSRLASLDPSYVHQLERDDERKRVPGRSVTLALGSALGMSYAERDRFLFVAGLAPETDWQTRCENAEAALRTVADALGVLTEAVAPTSLRSRAG